MTTEWAVSAAAEQITLDARNTGELMFTVANPGDAPDTVVFDIVPGDGSARSWFTVAEPQRLVPAHGSVTFLVKVAVPGGTAPRRYDLTGLAYSSSTAPEESSRSSGRITYEVKATEKPPNRLPWIIAAAVLVLVVGGVVAFLLTRSDDAFTQDLEAEKLVPTAVLSTPGPAGAAKIEEQKDTPALKFSGGGQALFTAFAIGDKVSFTVSVPKEGDYRISQIRTTDATYANPVWGVDGKAVGSTFLGFSTTPKLTGWVEVGTVHLTAGDHQLTLNVVGKTQATANYNAGVDAIRITEIPAG
jgi:hypothetical protein